MPCIFCIAVFAIFAGALTTVVLDQMEARLEAIAAGPVSRAVDSASVAKFELSVTIPRSGLRAARSVPVSVTVYKKHRRVRIQVMTHDLTRAEAEAIEDQLAAALELNIIDRSDAHDEQKVREAFGEDAELEAEAQPAQRQGSEAESEPAEAEAETSKPSETSGTQVARENPRQR